jgi:3'-phosphoadenosine 5'-phosphosulfate sulfotransferase (PAPS reductase)/FAD synthetase
LTRLGLLGQENNMSHKFDDQVVIPTLKSFVNPETSLVDDKGAYFSAPNIDLSIYDKVVLFMSGGKDSIACLLELLDNGVKPEKIELWHHDVDGREGSELMDWPFMVDYNKKLAAAFNLPMYFSWLRHGFEGEMLKDNAYSHPHHVETPDGIIVLERDTRRSLPSTRLKFPQVSANLQTRWCSSALKIDVGRRALNNQDRFLGLKTLVVSGERRVVTSSNLYH